VGEGVALAADLAVVGREYLEGVEGFLYAEIASSE
jgi:hypothetical protein